MGERIVVVDRIGLSPRERGSATGQTCPDFLELAGGETGVIGETPEALDSEQVSELLVVPPKLAYDALLGAVRS